jgi:hypothetical protein
MMWLLNSPAKTKLAATNRKQASKNRPKKIFKFRVKRNQRVGELEVAFADTSSVKSHLPPDWRVQKTRNLKITALEFEGAKGRPRKLDLRRDETAPQLGNGHRRIFDVRDRESIHRRI